MTLNGTFHDDYRWEGIDVLKYKEEGTHFKTITRQILFDGRYDIPIQLRYFEVAAGGYSTLEHHEHVHVVMVLRGEGEALVGESIRKLRPFDIVIIEPQTWHQFRASRNMDFGFLCMVRSDRDRPQLPDNEEKKNLAKNPAIAEFIRF